MEELHQSVSEARRSQGSATQTANVIPASDVATVTSGMSDVICDNDHNDFNVEISNNENTEDSAVPVASSQPANTSISSEVSETNETPATPVIPTTDINENTEESVVPAPSSQPANTSISSETTASPSATTSTLLDALMTKKQVCSFL